MQLVGAGRVEQGVEAGDLGGVDLGELGVGLVLDRPVGQHARAVDEAADGPELVAGGGDRRGDGRGVADVDLAVNGLRPGRLDPAEVPEDLAVGRDAAELLADDLRGRPAVGPRRPAPA